jgi:excisionase family DNA binding protein
MINTPRKEHGMENENETGMEKSIQSNLLTRKQAAQFLNLKKSTLDSWAVRGGGPVFAKMGKSVRYRLTDLEAFIEARLRQSTSEGARP